MTDLERAMKKVQELTGVEAALFAVEFQRRILSPYRMDNTEAIGYAYSTVMGFREELPKIDPRHILHYHKDEP